jgi:hypothetical protein
MARLPFFVLAPGVKASFFYGNVFACLLVGTLRISLLRDAEGDGAAKKNRDGEKARSADRAHEYTFPITVVIRTV